MKNPFSLNPVALRDLRQLVRSRIVSVGLAVFPGLLFAFTMLSVSNAMSGKPREELAFGDGLGSGPFTMVSVLTCIVAALGIPFYAAIKAILETKRESVGLEFTTALTPANIVGGRMAATAILSGAAVAMAMPFFIFAYLLRGVRLQDVFLVPFEIFASGLMIFSVSLAVACRKGSVALKVILTVLLFFSATALSNVPLAITMSRHGLSEPPPALEIAAWTGAALVTALVFFRAYCASILAPPHVDGDRPFRRVVLALFLLSIPLAVIFDSKAWAIGWTWVSGALLLQYAMSPRDIPRAAKGSAPRGFVRRAVSLPFTTGAAPGLLFSSAILALAVAVFCKNADPDTSLAVCSSIAEVTFPPILAGAVLRRAKASPMAYRRATWTMAALLILVSLVSFMAAVDAIGSHAGEMLPCNLIGIARNPQEHFRTYGVLLGFSLAIVAISSADAFRKYKRPQ